MVNLKNAKTRISIRMNGAKISPNSAGFREPENSFPQIALSSVPFPGKIRSVVG